MATIGLSTLEVLGGLSGLSFTAFIVCLQEGGSRAHSPSPGLGILHHWQQNSPLLCAMSIQISSLTREFGVHVLDQLFSSDTTLVIYYQEDQELIHRVSGYVIM
jgi:hypothetical protein